MVKPHRSKKRASPGGKPERRRPKSRGRPHASRKVTDTIKRRTHRPLSDFAGILSAEAAEEIRKAINQSRKERATLDRERLQWLIEAFDRSDDAAVLEAVSRKVKSAGLTPKKARDLLDKVKKESWNRTLKNGGPGE